MFDTPVTPTIFLTKDEQKTGEMILLRPAEFFIIVPGYKELQK